MKIKKIGSFFFMLSIVNSNCLLLAKDITFIPSLGITGRYDDNIFFTPDFKVEDYILIVSPALEFGYETERGAIDSKVKFDFWGYAEETDLNTTNVKGHIEGLYNIKERWRINGFMDVIKDTTLQSQLSETGQSGFLQDRFRLDAAGGLRYGLTAISNLGIDYRYTNVEFEDRSRNDYEVHQVSLPLEYHLETQTDFLSITPNYQYLESDTSTVDNIRLLLRWTHLFSKPFRMSMEIGPRYTKEDFKKSDETDKSPGITADINFVKRGEISRTKFQYRRDLRRSTDGRLLEVDRFVLDYDRQLAYRFGAGILGRLIFNRDEIKLTGGDNVYFDLRPSLFYNLTENHLLRLTYSYQHNYDRDEDERSERNRIWLTLQFNFP